MTIYPRHMAALQYSLLAIFLFASWQLLLSPAENVFEQFGSAFSASSEHPVFFFSFGFTAIASLLLGVSFWLKRSASPSLSAVLAAVSCLYLDSRSGNLTQHLSLVSALGASSHFGRGSRLTRHSTGRAQRRCAPVS